MFFFYIIASTSAKKYFRSKYAYTLSRILYRGIFMEVAMMYGGDQRNENMRSSPAIQCDLKHVFSVHIASKYTHVIVESKNYPDIEVPLP